MERHRAHDQVPEADGNTATLLRDGKVLVTGIAISEDLASAELYDPGHREVDRRRKNDRDIADGTATLLHGWQSAVDPVRYSAATPPQLYDPTSAKWTETGTLVQARLIFTATLLPDGRVLVTGGMTTRGDTSVLASAEVYDPGSGTWTATGGNMIEARAHHTGTLLQDGKVLVAGGTYPGSLSSAELYHPATGTWTATASMIHTRSRDRDPPAGWEGARDGRHPLRRHQAGPSCMTRALGTDVLQGNPTKRADGGITAFVVPP